MLNDVVGVDGRQKKQINKQINQTDEKPNI